MPTYRGGRHEHGQNFLTDRTAIDAVVDLTRRTSAVSYTHLTLPTKA